MANSPDHGDFIAILGGRTWSPRHFLSSPARLQVEVVQHSSFLIPNAAPSCRAKEASPQAKLKQYVGSLNDQFSRWVASQKEQKPDRFWSHGLMDYLRHSVIIKRDCASQSSFPPQLSYACQSSKCAWALVRAGPTPPLGPSLRVCCVLSLHGGRGGDPGGGGRVEREVIGTSAAKGRTSGSSCQESQAQAWGAQHEGSGQQFTGLIRQLMQAGEMSKEEEGDPTASSSLSKGRDAQLTIMPLRHTKVPPPPPPPQAPRLRGPACGAA